MEDLYNATTEAHGNWTTAGWQDVLPTQKGHEMLSVSMKIFLTTYLGVVCLFGTFGNLLTLSAIYSTIDLHTVPNAYVCNLAVTDLLICLISTPVTMLANIMEIPRGVCLVFGMIWYVTLLESFVSMAAIALNRYIIICSSHSGLNAMCTSRGTPFFIAASWLYVVSMCSAPYIFGFGEYAYSPFLGTCSLGEEPEMWTFSTIVGTFLIFIPSVLITSICYWKVLQKFLTARRSVETGVSNYEEDTPDTNISTTQQTGGAPNKKKTTANSKKKSKGFTVAKNLFIVWICFIIFWTPIILLHKVDYQRNLQPVLYRLLMSLGFTNSAINIIIYSVMNQSFRQAYARLLHLKVHQ